MNHLSKAKFFVISLFAFASFVACSQDELPEVIQEEQSLQINISIAGFASGNPETRTSESGYTTTFTTNDEIGITVLSSNNEILQNNVPYKYTGSAWMPAGSKEVTYYSGATYLVYYPYSATMDGKKTAAEILSAFTPQTDQSSLSGYTASDLMTGTGTISGSMLNVFFVHALALMEVKLSAQYILQGTAYTYKTAPPLNPVFSVNSGQVPFYPVNDSVFRYIVKPNAPITVSGIYSGISWSKQFTSQAGQYKRLNVRDNVIVTPSAKFAEGDYYPVVNDPLSAMGVVYEISNGGINGKIVSLDEVQTYWGPLLSGSTNEYDGILNTDAIKNLPVFALAKAKNGGGTTPWYIPAIGEMFDVLYYELKNKDINSKIKIAGGQAFESTAYWSSTQTNGKAEYYGNLYRESSTTPETSFYSVRAIMKF